MDKHPYFEELKDSRITIFTNCIVALDGVIVCFIVRSFELWEDEWWENIRQRVHEFKKPEPRGAYVKGFNSFTVTSYFNLMFIALENSFRTFYKLACPSKAKEPGAFFNVYDDLLKKN
jgi:hypothetical protein